MALDWFDEPFKSEKFDSLFTEEKKEEKSSDKEKDKKDKKEEDKDKKEEKEPVIKELKVNPDDTLDRIELVTDRYGYRDDPAVFADDKKNSII